MAALSRPTPSAEGPPEERKGAAGGSPPAIAEVNDLHLRLHRDGQAIDAIRGVSLQIQPGEIIGLVGESGSGKTMLGLSLLGLLPPASHPRVTGEVAVAGVDMLRGNDRDRRLARRHSLGAVFQDPMTSLNPTMRVGSQVIEKAGSAERALELLEAVQIPSAAHWMQAYPHQLSGGLRQRVMMAIALAGDPRLVVADEPTTALDVTVQARILKLIRELRDQFGCAFLLVTHDIGVASEVADRIAVMYGGRIAELGPTEALLAKPRHPYTVALLLSRLTLDTDRSRPIERIPGEPPDPTAPPPGCPFAERCPARVEACDVQPPPLSGPGTHLDACVRSEEVEAGAVMLAPPRDPWPPIAAKDVPILKVKDVVKTFRSSRRGKDRAPVSVLRGIDLEIRAGGSVALVGESGCGKSTLLRVIAGLLEAGGGTLEHGSEVPPQMIFQDAGASLTPWFTVGDLIDERLRLAGVGADVRAARVAETLERVGLSADLSALKPVQLSGGQRQRAAIARAVAVPSRLLLCDEPTSALDPSLAAMVLNLLGRLRRELEMAILFVTHDIGAARLIADQIAVMYQGRIVELGPSQQVIDTPLHPYTRLLLSAVPGLHRDPDAEDLGDPATATDSPSGCSFHPRCQMAATACGVEAPKLVEAGRGHWASCVHVEAGGED